MGKFPRYFGHCRYLVTHTRGKLSLLGQKKSAVAMEVVETPRSSKLEKM